MLNSGTFGGGLTLGVKLGNENFVRVFDPLGLPLFRLENYFK